MMTWLKTMGLWRLFTDRVQFGYISSFGVQMPRVVQKVSSGVYAKGPEAAAVRHFTSGLLEFAGFIMSPAHLDATV